jgi:hypothetical protein
VTKRHAPAALVNRDPLLAALRRVLPLRGKVLEIASGTGEHAVHFARALPGLVWQPSDPDCQARESIAAWSAEAGLPNLRPPLDLDVTLATWRRQLADAVVCVNLLHIAPWEVTEGLLGGSAQVLSPGGPLCIYGPFRAGGTHLSERNADFDARLRAADPRWGVRDADEVERLARAHGLEPDDRAPMPSHNLLLVLRRPRPAAGQI